MQFASGRMCVEQRIISGYVWPFHMPAVTGLCWFSHTCRAFCPCVQKPHHHHQNADGRKLCKINLSVDVQRLCAAHGQTWSVSRYWCGHWGHSGNDNTAAVYITVYANAAWYQTKQNGLALCENPECNWNMYNTDPRRWKLWMLKVLYSYNRNTRRERM